MIESRLYEVCLDSEIYCCAKLEAWLGKLCEEFRKHKLNIEKCVLVIVKMNCLKYFSQIRAIICLLRCDINALVRLKSKHCQILMYFLKRLEGFVEHVWLCAGCSLMSSAGWFWEVLLGTMNNYY